jgi:hypothetical protein
MSLDISFNFYDATLEELEKANIPHDVRLYKVMSSAKRLQSVVLALTSGTISLYQDLDERHIDQVAFCYNIAKNLNEDIIEDIEGVKQFKDFFDTILAIKNSGIKATIHSFF